MSSVSVNSSVTISDNFTVFIDLNTILDKLRSMLKDDSIPMVNKLQAVSSFQTLLDIRMTIISKLFSESYVIGCKSLKKEIDDILNEIKDLLVSEHKDDVFEKLDELGTFKNVEFIYCFKFDVLRDKASEQIEAIDNIIVKLLVSASIYVQKLRSEYNKFIEEDDDETFNNIVELINNYYTVITERNKLIEVKSSESKSAIRDEYLNMLKNIHDLVNSDASRDDMKSEVSKLVSHLIPSSLSTRSMVILVGGVVESNKHSLY